LELLVNHGYRWLFDVVGIGKDDANVGEASRDQLAGDSVRAWRPA